MCAHRGDVWDRAGCLDPKRKAAVATGLAREVKLTSFKIVR